jgi:hypothetical protein
MTNEGRRGGGLQFEISNLRSCIGHWSLVIGHLHTCENARNEGLIHQPTANNPRPVTNDQ